MGTPERITLDEQLDRWVAGESVHAITGRHGHLRALSPPGPPERRRWKCEDCGARGSYEELEESADCPTGGECCPDFSCCTDAETPLEERQAFASAAPAEREAMLLGYLADTLADAGADVSVGVTLHSEPEQ
jgi:hypothetical protein